MSKVSRSVFQKLSEENKRLKDDIRTLVQGKVFDIKKIEKKWRIQFNRERQLYFIATKFAKDYIQEHKNELPDFITKPNDSE